MVKDPEVARHISELILEFGGRLDSTVHMVAQKCSDEELLSYKQAVGKVLGEMLLEIMNPLYREHPLLKPHGLD